MARRTLSKRVVVVDVVQQSRSCRTCSEVVVVVVVAIARLDGAVWKVEGANGETRHERSSVARWPDVLSPNVLPL